MSDVQCFLPLPVGLYPYKTRFSVEIPLQQNQGSRLTDKREEVCIIAAMFDCCIVMSSISVPPKYRQQEASAVLDLACWSVLMESPGGIRLSGFFHEPAHTRNDLPAPSAAAKPRSCEASNQKPQLRT
jgi:hypothetical protein